MTNTQLLITIAIISLTTILTRYLPFIIFPPTKEPPQFINYLGTVLPTAAIGLLVIYALKDTIVLSYPFALPEIIAVAIISIIHLKFRRFLLSVITGTFVYMFLIQFMF